MLAASFLIALFVSNLTSAQGSEVYLQDITIFKTHDPSIGGKFYPPSIYFYCEHDGRPKIELKDVKKLNHTYTYTEEATVLTHVDSGECRTACGIKDADLIGSDDIFGHTFEVCDNAFDKDSHKLSVVIPSEVTLTLYCPACNPGSGPPPAPPPPASADGSRKRNTMVASIVFGAVLAGIAAGIFVAIVVRAWYDDEADEARQRFHALYADPAAEIEDLPASMPRIRRKTAISHLARWLRQTWVKARGKGPYQNLTEYGPGQYT